MTREELQNFMVETLGPALEQAWLKQADSEKKLAEQRRELEDERKARKAAEKKTSDKEKENEALRKALEDERDKNKTHVRNKFGSSRRSSLFSSHKRAEASCILRSLIETCKLWKVSVCEYFNKIYTAFSVGRTDYDNLMPWCMPSFS